MLEKVLDDPNLRSAAERIARGSAVKMAGLWGSAAPLAAVAMGRMANRPVLYIATHLDTADDVADDVEVFTGRPAQLFPAWEVDLGTEHINDEVAGERIRLCNMLTQPPAERAEPTNFIVAPIMALLQPVPTLSALRAAQRTVTRAEELDPHELMAWLVDAGFERVDQVDQQGEFARRGGIVDIFPPGANLAVRIEFFGDEIDSIRRFDLDTQRSVDTVEGYVVTGFSAGRQGPGEQTTTLLSYLPPETLVCVLEPGEVITLGQELYRRICDMESDVGARTRAEEWLARHTDQVGGDPDESGETDTTRGGLLGEPPADVLPPVHSAEAVFAAAEAFARVEMFTFAPKGRPDVIDLGVRSLQRLETNTHEALTELAELSDSADVWVFCENAAEQKRFAEVLAGGHEKLASRVRTSIGHVHGGFHWPGRQMVVVGHHEIFRRYTKVRRIRRVRAGRPIQSLIDLEAGDYVVHVAHGVARFEGLKMLDREGRSEEYLRLRFAGRAILHVPASEIHLVQRYIGTRGKRPALSGLGSETWARQKQRVTEAVEDLAAEMLRIQAMRQSITGTSYRGETDWQKQFCQEFVYTETEDQINSMRQIDVDMVAQRPMDRLLCGDVGFGKTELAMRAAFKVAESGKQVAVLVPTTLLAEQHYRTFRERFADYPFEIEMISRFRSRGQQTEILKRLLLGRIDVLIGTHRILSQDVSFADLGLVIIDEEQRFGVAHKERLKAARATVDVLTLTATPIPRTLHMALLGLRDISSLTTPPLDRRAIHTEVCHYDDGLIRRALLRELTRRGQTFFVHNRVVDIASVADHLQTLVPEARVACAHGQMTEGRLEKTMLRFVRREIDVLVCTTIIESGLDIPTANTIIVHEADRFGLADLHQLRGRVGRYKHRAYCYLLLPQRHPVALVAAKRLKAVEEFSDLGAGFQIAMRDLEIRGAGNILGREQSGHIATVGYELYCQLLEQSVCRMQGRAVPLRISVHVELGLDVYIPRSYINSERQRMEVYRRLARCSAVEELTQFDADLRDAFGPVPPGVRTMLDLVEIRVRAGLLGIESIIRMDPDIIFSVQDFSRAECAFDGAAGSVRLADEHTAHWRPPAAYLEMPTLTRVLLKRLRGGGGT